MVCIATWRPYALFGVAHSCKPCQPGQRRQGAGGERCSWQLQRSKAEGTRLLILPPQRCGHAQLPWRFSLQLAGIPCTISLGTQTRLPFP
eukprot:350140-Chlamydomonas_euryale.AAC.3